KCDELILGKTDADSRALTSEALDPFSFDEEEQMVLWALPFKLEQTTQLRLVMPKETDTSLCLPLRS
ncbi:MAG: hypothetical protein QMB40_10160, partial [Aeromonadaceae bacterium]